MIVDYKMGNLASVTKALERAGARPSITNDPREVGSGDLLVLPGVGNFKAGIGHLEELGLIDPVWGWARSGGLVLGICLGMQLLFESSEEGGSKGLDILKGEVRQIQGDVKVPHMGWNTIEADSGLFQPFSGKRFYFDHSYVCVPADQDGLTTATTEHGEKFVSGLEAGNVIGVQFHPEKSGDDGIELLAHVLEKVQ